MISKSREQILFDLEQRLKASTSITNTDPGSVAKTFLEVLTEEFYEFYTELELTVAMGFVSTSSGRFLDLIGQLLDCAREYGELDDEYRARIVNQVYVVAGANITALRLKALTVEGVSDVVFKEYSQGAGSFSCYVITNDLQTSRETIREVEAIINKTKGFGIYAEVKSPVLIPVSLMVRLVFNNDAGVTEKNTIRQNAVKAVKNYIDSLKMGDQLILNEIVEQVMSTSTKIKDLDIYSLTVNETSRYITNVSSNWNEKFVMDSISIT